MLQITAFYAGALALLFFALSANVIRHRGRSGISLGLGADKRLERAVRGHSNFAEFTPIIVLLVGIAELNDAPPAIVHGLGASLLLGRVLHGYCVAMTDGSVWSRATGTAVTFLALVAGGLYSLWTAFA